MKTLKKEPNRFVVWRTSTVADPMTLEAAREEAKQALGRNPSRTRVFIVEVIEVVEPTAPQTISRPFTAAHRY